MSCCVDFLSLAYLLISLVDGGGSGMRVDDSMLNYSFSVLCSTLALPLLAVARGKLAGTRLETPCSEELVLKASRTDTCKCSHTCIHVAYPHKHATQHGLHKPMRSKSNCRGQYTYELLASCDSTTSV